MIRILSLLSMALFTVILATTLVFAGPFTGGGKKGDAPEAGKQVEFTQQASSGPFSWLVGKAIEVQRTIKRSLTQLGRKMRDNPYGSPFWIFLGLTFLYGIAHAIGPGHGKAVVCAYFSGNAGSYLQGAAMGGLLVMTHVASATVLVMGGYWALGKTGLRAFHEHGVLLEQTSYALLIAIGLLLIVFNVRQWFQPQPTDEREWHLGEKPKARKRSNAKAYLVSAAAGLVPCPGAAIILIFTVGQGLVLQGLAAMVTLAVGMALTVIAVAVFTITARKTTMFCAARNSRTALMVSRSLAMGSALVIVAFGLLMFLGTR